MLVLHTARDDRSVWLSVQLSAAGLQDLNTAEIKGSLCWVTLHLPPQELGLNVWTYTEAMRSHAVYITIKYFRAQSLQGKLSLILTSHSWLLQIHRYLTSSNDSLPMRMTYLEALKLENMYIYRFAMFSGVAPGCMWYWALKVWLFWIKMCLLA
jgi:hypothetical protein